MRRLCRETGARVHIVHLASGEALAEVEAARREGLPFSAETCPHYLAFTDGDLDRLGALLKTAPVVKGDGRPRGALAGPGVGRHPARGDRPRGGGVAAREDDRVDLERLRRRSGRRADGSRTSTRRACGRARITLERMVELVSSEPARFFGVGQAEGTTRAGIRRRLLRPRPGRSVDGGTRTAPQPESLLALRGPDFHGASRRDRREGTDRLRTPRRRNRGFPSAGNRAGS